MAGGPLWPKHPMGPPGPPGSAGAGTTILVQSGGVPLPGTFTTINFGAGLSATAGLPNTVDVVLAPTVAGDGLFMNPAGVINVGANADGSIVVNPDDIQVSAAIQSGAAAGATALQVAGAGLTEAPAEQVNVGNVDGSIVIGADEIHVSAAIQSGAAAGATALQSALQVAGAGLTESPAGTVNVGQNADNSVVVNANDVQVAAAIQSGAALGTTSVQPARTLTAGAGLTGGGDLSANRTFDVGQNADNSVLVNANDVQVNPTLQAGASTSEIVRLPAAIVAAIGDKAFRYIVVENDNTPTQIGITANQLNAAAYVAPTNADLRTGTPRINTSSNSANVLVGNNYTDPPCCRGSVPGVGGFFICYRFAIVALLSDAVVSIGLNAAVIAGGANPTGTANRIVLGADTGDANLSWISVDNAVASTKSAAVISKANILIGDPNTNGPCVYEVRMWALPNDTKITCQLLNRSAGTVVNTSDISATLPLNTANLRPTMVMSSKTNGAPATSCDFFHWFAYY